MANIRLTANETRFVNSMNNAAGSVGRLSAELNIRLARAMREADNIARNFQQGIGRLGDRIASVGKSLSTYLTAPIIALGVAAGAVYGDIDQLKRGLDVYGISLNEIKKTAKLPGLGLEEAAKSTITFASVKFAADLSSKAVREFGNALVYSGRGKEELAGIATAFAQMKGKGNVMAQEVNQIAERLPMIRDLMQKAFGTSDTEVIQKKGIKADKFLEEIVKQLEKLPRVSGGFKVAMENIGDSLKIGAYEMMNAADKAFGLTTMFNKVSEWIDGIVETFKQLSPEAQRIIFVIVGITAAIGPLLVVIGVFTSSVIPALLTGWSKVRLLLTSINIPLLIAIAAFAFATRQIIQHWDSIKAYLDKTGILDTAIEIINYGLALIGDLVMVFVNFFTGDWSSMWENIKNIAKRAWNGIITVIAESVKLTVKLFRGAVGFFGFDGMAKGADSTIAYIDAVTSSIKATVPESIFTLSKLGAALNALTKPPKTTGGGGGGGIPAPEGLKGLNINELKFIGDLDLKVKEYGTRVLNTIHTVAVSIQTGFREFGLSSFAANKFSNQITETWNKVGMDFTKAGDNLKKKYDALVEKLKMGPAELLKQSSKGLNILVTNSKTQLDQLNDQFDQMFTELQTNLLTNVGSGFGEALGKALTGGGFDMSNIFKSILMTIGDFMIQLGQQMLKMGSLIEVAKKLFGTTPGIGAAIAVIAGGGLLKGLAGGMGNKTPKFANGGLVYGPTMGLMGEYPGARNNPEVIAPLSKLKDLIGSGGGGNIVAGEIRLEGEAIIIPLNRYLKRNGLPTLG
ncbi:tape measure protein [Emticicia fontis]